MQLPAGLQRVLNLLQPTEQHDRSATECQLTPRALIAGLGIGSLLCCSNMYFGLQTGWVTMGSLQSAILGYGIFQLLHQLQKARALTIPENVIIQTTAVATATMPLAAGLVGVVPALGMMTAEENPPTGPVTLEFGQMLLWSLGLAFFGVFFAPPLRSQTIVREQLPFPSGSATAYVIRTLHQADAAASMDKMHARHADAGEATGEAGEEDDEEADERAPLTGPAGRLSPSATSLELADGRTAAVTVEEGGIMGAEGVSDWRSARDGLLWSFTVTLLYMLLAAWVPWLKSFPVFTWFGLPAVTAWGWEVSVSPGYIGQGMIMGPRTALSMLAGAIIGYGVLGPHAKFQGWAPGPIGDWQTGAAGWVMWVSLAIMLTDSLTSLGLLMVKETWKQAKKVRSRGHMALEGGASRGSATSGDKAACQVPSRWWGTGLGGSLVLCTAIMAPMFHMPLYQPLLAVAVALVVALVAVRALGETDLNPVTGVGKVSQLVMAVAAPKQVVPNLVAGAIAEAGAQQAGDMMQDFKTAYLLGVCPRSQFLAMLLGSTASIFISVAAFKLFTTAYQIPGPEFAVPSAAIWIDMARLVNGGKLPPMVGPYCLVAAALAVGLLLVQMAAEYAAVKMNGQTPSGRTARKIDWLLRRLLPSGVALAVGMYISPKWTIPRVIGSMTEQAWRRISPGSHRSLMLVIASGLVLGEGIASLLLAVGKVITK